MLINVLCQCGAIVEVTPREDAPAQPCQDCHRPVNVRVGSPAELAQSPAEFEMSEPAPRRSLSWRLPSGREGLEQHLHGLVANTERSVQALEGRLTAAELEQIHMAMERAKEARAGQATLDELAQWLQEMERSAELIGLAMLRR
jgi:hypothetical protein